MTLEDLQNLKVGQKVKITWPEHHKWIDGLPKHVKEPFAEIDILVMEDNKLIPSTWHKPAEVPVFGIPKFEIV